MVDMIFSILAIVIGLIILVYSADRFIEGSASVAKHFEVSPLLIGMVIVGFGTSSPELMVSALSAYNGNPGIALGNAYGSNITNIALILGISALINPISVHSKVLKKELPILTVITIIASIQLFDGNITRMDAGILIIIFSFLMVWSVWESKNKKDDILAVEVESELKDRIIPLKKAFFWLILGLLLLIISSRILVWGAVTLAKLLGISDLIIGLTIVAVGTSLPELASSIIAAKKGEHDIALGNIVGSNLFNTLAVVGLAGMIKPMNVDQDILYRDIPVMFLLTLSLFIFGYGFKRTGRINRYEGFLLLSSYIAYTSYLVYQIVSKKV